MGDRILLLEDDLSLIEGLQYSLKKNDFELEIARTVNEALGLHLFLLCAVRQNEFIICLLSIQ